MFAVAGIGAAVAVLISGHWSGMPANQRLIAASCNETILETTRSLDTRRGRRSRHTAATQKPPRDSAPPEGRFSVGAFAVMINEV